MLKKIVLALVLTCGASFALAQQPKMGGVGRNYITSQIINGQLFGNVEGYSKPEIDKLFADGAVATLGAKRKEIYEKAQKILVEDVPVAWLLELQFPTITRCKIKDLITTAIGVNDGFRDAWIDK
jgi:peptide/nickel transport system substrate-binding protein